MREATKNVGKHDHAATVALGVVIRSIHIHANERPLAMVAKRKAKAGRVGILGTPLNFDIKINLYGS